MKIDESALLAAVRDLPRFSQSPPTQLTALARKGLMHLHYRIPDGRAVLRVPVAAFGGLDAAASLERQATAFERAQLSDATPRLLAMVAPCDGVPFGALLVDDIRGAAPRLPGELPTMAHALAAIHKLKIPSAMARLPLPSPVDPVGQTVADIHAHLNFAPRAALDPKAEAVLGQELAWARDFAKNNAQRLGGLTRSLCVVDAHPGNFIVAVGVRAYFVDLEKCSYGLPGLDVAHASTYPATSWDADIAATLSAAEMDGFLRAWAARVGDPIASETAAWMRPFRRLIWLRTTAAFVRFRAEGAHKDLDERARTHVQYVMDTALKFATLATQRKIWS